MKCFVLSHGREMRPPAKCLASSYAFFMCEEAEVLDDVESIEAVDVAERGTGKESVLGVS